ncbi:MAG: CDP-diacylglycerol--glycerol-3-phosphate 3-phosphatidyltransferase [Alphaproteobacteria bacterium]|nr:CDP-diacylglycerol--glycerol-3-phosphate 3-phosphatidyltransferase [Alphaproteobacteria bacterium]
MIATLPNLLSLSRVAVIPFLVALTYWDQPFSGWLAGTLFAAAALTDLFDGYLARKRSQVSDFGRLLDPIADKLLVCGTLMVVVGSGAAHVLPALVIVLREILVSGLREFLAGHDTQLPVTRLAKWKTALQMVAIGLLLVGGPLLEAGRATLWVAALVTAVTGWHYLRTGLARVLAGTPKA